MQLFRSATLKLTVWYLGILMVISIAFSVLIYQVNLNEVSARLETLQRNLLDDSSFRYLPQEGSATTGLNAADALRTIELQTASHQLVSALVRVNIIVMIVGGLGSYVMARRTLRPIETAHEAQSRFTSDASHELRTPLAAMKAEIEVNLRDPNLTAGEARELLESNLEEVDKLISISEMLLHLSRLEYDRLEVSTVDFPTLLADILKKHPEAARFEVKSRKKAATQANEAAVGEVLEIFMDNALKYSPKDKPITMRIFEQHGHIAFRIKNSGPQINKESIDRLFDRFYRADKSRTKSNNKGYGLGLSIAKKIVELHGGYITVSSNARETSFTTYFPIVKPAPEPVDSEASQS